MLVHPLEHGVLLPHLSLYLKWREHRTGLIPQLVQQLRVQVSEHPLGPQRILLINLRYKVPSQEVLRQRHRVTQALQGAIHEAGVPQVGQAHNPQLGPRLRLVVDRTHVHLLHRVTVLQMVALVLGPALFVTVLHLLTRTGYLQRHIVVTALTLPMNPRVPVVLENELPIGCLLLEHDQVEVAAYLETTLLPLLVSFIQKHV